MATTFFVVLLLVLLAFIGQFLSAGNRSIAMVILIAIIPSHAECDHLVSKLEERAEAIENARMLIYGERSSTYMLFLEMKSKYDECVVALEEKPEDKCNHNLTSCKKSVADLTSEVAYLQEFLNWNIHDQLIATKAAESTVAELRVYKKNQTMLLNKIETLEMNLTRLSEDNELLRNTSVSYQIKIKRLSEKIGDCMDSETMCSVKKKEYAVKLCDLKRKRSKLRKDLKKCCCNSNNNSGKMNRKDYCSNVRKCPGKR